VVHDQETDGSIATSRSVQDRPPANTDRGWRWPENLEPFRSFISDHLPFFPPGLDKRAVRWLSVFHRQ
jgi:hypothetical protein